MDSQKNSDQIIVENWLSDKLDKIEIDYNNHLKMIEAFYQAVKDETISFEEMQRGVEAAETTMAIEYYNEHMLDLHGRQKKNERKKGVM